MFRDAVIYDQPQGIGSRKEVNQCDLAIVCVPTDLTPMNVLDTSIVEDVVSWLRTPLILIKSALMPGTTDQLIKKYKKRIAVSVEFIGEGKYFIPPKYPDPQDPTKHQMIIVGGEEQTATECAEFLWDKMSPDVKIHLTSALEAEIVKLIENAYGALKVTFINSLYTLATNAGGNFIKVHQAWQSDPRTDSMHLRTISWKRGWKSKCWSKDLVALREYARMVGADDMELLFNSVITINEAYHLAQNEKD